MGFYGNVTNTDKTTFSFDLTYNTRLDMDKNANTDGVFLGRYVLIDYDGEVVKAYYNPETDRFYNTANFQVSTVIQPHESIIMQNLHDAMSPQSFYQWNKVSGQYSVLNANTVYQARFAQDVKEYGRAYDSTVWVKRFDTVTGTYKYAMIAELNAVVPTLHMVVNQPNTIPVTPYFDRDTTNIDYYLHMQSDFGTRVKKADQNLKSDEEATRIIAHWTQDASGHQAYHEDTETVPADIYYNNAGFDHILRTFMEDKVKYRLVDDNGNIIEGKEEQEADYTKNAIGYTMGQSGRKYGADADFGVYTNGVQADDIYDWYFRLPGIGNAICKMWDKIYDDRGNGQIRALNKSQMKNDTNSHLVSYDKETLIGMMNTAQELLGYQFVPTNDVYKLGYEVSKADEVINLKLSYNTFNPDPEKPQVLEQNISYKLLNCLFYDKPTQENRAVTQYYHFAYTPTYTPVTGEELEKGVTYYHFVNGKWELANPAIYKQTDANGDPIVDANTNQTLAIGSYHTRNNKWTLVPLEFGVEDNFYSLINLIHNLIGTDADDVRSLDTMKGTINHIKDIIANINLDLSPGKLLHTNNSGVIETTETYFPSADWDKDELLAGDGSWVSRYASIKVRENSENANRKIPKVVEFETTGETAGSAPVNMRNLLTVLKSDNQKMSCELAKATAEHRKGSADDKYEQLKYYYENQQLSESEYQMATAEHDKAIARYNAWMACTEGREDTDLVYVPDHDPNTLIFATRDKWIKLHPDDTDDSIEFEHTQSPIVNRLSFQALAYPDKITNITGPKDDANSTVDTANFKANADGTELTIVPDSDSSIVYNTTKTDSGDNHHPDMNDNRLTIPYITVDNAGHVVAASTKNYNIPHGFKKVATTTIGDTNEEPSLDKAGISIAENISDTLNIAPRNRWIDIATETTNNNEGDEEDTITWSHRLINDLSKVNDKIEKDGVSVDYLNGERRSSEDAIPTVYRFGLPQDKNIDTLDKVNGKEAANTFNVPYVEIDKAGHVVAAETHTVELPENFTTVTLKPQDESTEAEAHTVIEDTVLAADTLTDNLTLKTVNRWIGIGLTDNEDNDEITFGHRLSDIKDVTPLALNGKRRANEKYKNIYRYGLPQSKSVEDLDSAFGGYDSDNNKITDSTLIKEPANTFNVPYVEIDEAGHIVYAETNTVTLPENFTTLTLNPQNESSIDEAHTISEQKVLEADTLTDNLTFTTVNRWIGLGLNSDTDEITFGHRLSDIKDVVPLELNGERRADNKYEKVYRYGLEADKDISTLDENNGVELANTFNVPYMEIDEAGHIVHAETHTIELPDGYTTINIGDPISDDLTTDELADAETMTADTLTETLTINPSNKWIRLKGENKKGIDTITIGHEIHKITPTTSAEDLDSENQKDKFTTQTVTWDDAGHIIGHDTKTWTLPDSFHNFKVIGQSTSVNNGNLSNGDISADNTFDTITFKPSNKWIRLYADEEFDTIEIGHVTYDGKAGSYTGTDTTFIPEEDTQPRFGESVTLYGYETDEAGHIINNPTYTLTLPKGSYEETENNSANVLTSLSFTDKTGALVGSKTNIGDLLLTGYTTENIASAAITATDSLNKAVAKIEAQILKEQTDRIADVDTEEQERIKAIDAEAKARADADIILQENINKETEDREAAISEEASARAKADEDEIAARDKAIADAVQALWQDLLQNYNLVLTPPTINSISKTAIDSNYSVQLVANITAVEGDTYSYSWNTGEIGNTIEVTTAGIYTCTVTRTHNGYTSTSSKDIEVLESEIPVPVIPEEPVEPQPEEPIV